MGSYGILQRGRTLYCISIFTFIITTVTAKSQFVYPGQTVYQSRFPSPPIIYYQLHSQTPVGYTQNSVGYPKTSVVYPQTFVGPAPISVGQFHPVQDHQALRSPFHSSDVPTPTLYSGYSLEKLAKVMLPRFVTYFGGNPEGSVRDQLKTLFTIIATEMRGTSTGSKEVVSELLDFLYRIYKYHDVGGIGPEAIPTLGKLINTLFSEPESSVHGMDLARVLYEGIISQNVKNLSSIQQLAVLIVRLIDEDENASPSNLKNDQDFSITMHPVRSDTPMPAAVSFEKMLQNLADGKLTDFRESFREVLQILLVGDRLTAADAQAFQSQFLANPPGSKVTDEDINLVIDNLFSAGGGSDAGVLFTDMIRGMLTGQTGVEGDQTVQGLFTQATVNENALTDLLGLQNKPLTGTMLRAKVKLIGTTKDEIYFAQGRSRSGMGRYTILTGIFKGLEPGKYRLEIHRTGRMDGNCELTGGQFRNNAGYNFEVKRNGRGVLFVRDEEISLLGTKSVLGRSAVLKRQNGQTLACGMIIFK